MADRYASLKQGLVGAWIPSVSGSGLLLPDLSGRGNNGVLTNMDASDWVSSQYGRALDFDGSNDYIEIPSASQFRFGDGVTDFPFSVSFWVNKLNFVSGDFIGRNNANASQRLWRIILSGASDQFLFVLYDQDVNNSISAEVFPVTIDDGSWHHVCCTYSGSRQNTGLKIYFDGREQSVTRLSSGTYVAMEDLEFPIWIGRVSTLYSSFTGDDTRIYNRALTEPEIRLLSSEPGIGFKPAKKLSRFSQRYTYKPPKAKVFEGVRVRDHDYASLRQGLVGAWCPSLPNGGSGNTLPDVSGRSNHGTLTNMGPEDWVSGQYGRALDFDGVNDVVIASRTSEINSFRGVYASAWIFPRNNNVAKTVFKNGYTNNTGNNPFDGIQLVAWSDGNLYGSIRNTSVVDTDFSASAPYSANSWIHMAVWVGIDGIIRLYVNGRQTGTTQDASAIASSSLSFGAPPTIGARYETSLTLLTYFNGVIDDVRWGYSNTDSIFGLLASRPGIGLQPSPTRLIAKEKKTGLRRKILTGQT